MASVSGAPAPEPSFLSIVMPCLDEAETLERCIVKAARFLEETGARGEIIVADNGSTDGSREIAVRLGARVVPVAARGYGNALLGGIRASRGEWIVMGDADDSYDFSALHPFVERLRAGDDLVMGNRFRGGIRPGAMPWLHRWLGNPVLSWLGRALFRAQAGDFHCGLRAFRRDAFDRMELTSAGMEFASEMVIKASLFGMRVTEVPTVLHPDGRSRPPHLRTWRDGWRHLRFMLLFSPRWLFFGPGVALMALGAGLVLALLPGSLRVGSIVLDIHTMYAGALMLLFGNQLVGFARVTWAFTEREGLRPARKGARRASLETVVLFGLALAVAGAGVVGLAVIEWRDVQFGDLEPTRTMRLLVPGATLFLFGVQTIYTAFLLAVLALPRPGERAP